MRGVLDGIRVLEWGIAHMVPAATTTLGDLGAEVIKIETRNSGDPHRGNKVSGGVKLQAPDGRSYYFEGLNRGKKSVTVDLTKESGRQVVYRLAKESDVFVTNFRQGAVAKCGMSYAILRGYNPRLIYASISAYGSKGPDSDEPGFDLAAQARAGLMTLMKSPKDVPSSPWGLADQAGSMTVAFGIISALFARARYGIGQKLNFSILGSVMWLENTSLLIRLLGGEEPHPINREEAVNPLWNVYQTQDGKWICLSHGYWGSSLWSEFCQAVGIQELEHDPRFDTHLKRIESGTPLVSILDKVFAGRPREEWLKIAKKWGLIFQPVNTISDLLTDPQVLENEYIVNYDHPCLGKIRLPGFPVQFSETPAQVTRPAPELGQHTEEVLSEVAGYTWEEIEQLHDQEII
jgi:crotonobetainyl-CoA:carnitine CoA-transferase CaiB-like acyl-CoA transferase